MTYFLVMCGGVGSRLYPLSSPDQPKQFCDLIGNGQTLIEATVGRIAGLQDSYTVVYLTSEKYRQFFASLPYDNHKYKSYVLYEPCMRNTAPAILYGCAFISMIEAQRQKSAAEQVSGPGARVIVLPSDHYIGNEEEFRQCLKAGLEFSSINPQALITFGIQPTFPATGYGYIRADDIFSMAEEKNAHISANSGLTYSGKSVRRVAEFKEKPDEATAKQFVRDGYLWNAGIFLFSLHGVLREFETLMKSSYDLICDKRITESTVCQSSLYPLERIDDIFSRAVAPVYEQCEKISFDYAVLERSGNVYVLPCAFDWSDLGSYKSLLEHSARDASGCAGVGVGVRAVGSSRCYARSLDNSVREIVFSGVNDVAAVVRDGTVYIINMNDEESVKKL